MPMKSYCCSKKKGEGVVRPGEITARKKGRSELGLACFPAVSEGYVQRGKHFAGSCNPRASGGRRMLKGGRRKHSKRRICYGKKKLKVSHSLPKGGGEQDSSGETSPKIPFHLGNLITARVAFQRIAGPESSGKVS